MCNQTVCIDPVEVPVCKLVLDKNALELATPDLRIGKETKWPMRYMGKQVYAQLVDFGSLPNNTTKKMQHKIADVDWIQADPTYSRVTNFPNTASLPIAIGAPADSRHSWYPSVDRENISYFTGIDRTSLSATLCLIYTKLSEQPIS